VKGPVEAVSGETRTLLREVLDRLPGLALAGPVERLRSSFISGPRHMPVRFRAA
jgi:cytochrome P450